MSSIWSSSINLDMTIPSNGSATPGSGTIYIGGPRLPSELVAAGFKGALVFFSDAAGLAAGIKYWYLAHITVGGSESLSMGSCDTLGALTDVVAAQYDLGTHALIAALTDNNGASVNVSTDVLIQSFQGSVDLSALKPTGSDVVLQASRNVQLGAVSQVVLNPGSLVYVISPSLKFDQGGTGPSLTMDGTNVANGPIKTKVTTNGPTYNNPQDTWNSSSTLQTVNGIANFQCNIYWRWTADYICEVRFFLLSSGPVPSGSTLTCNMPANFPSVDYAPGNPRGPAGVAIGSGGANLTTMASRIQTGTPNTLQVFMSGNPNNNIGFEGSFVFTLAK